MFNTFESPLPLLSSAGLKMLCWGVGKVNEGMNSGCGAGYVDSNSQPTFLTLSLALFSFLSGGSQRQQLHSGKVNNGGCFLTCSGCSISTLPNTRLAYIFVTCLVEYVCIFIHVFTWHCYYYSYYSYHYFVRVLTAPQIRGVIFRLFYHSFFSSLFLRVCGSSITLLPDISRKRKLKNKLLH